MYKKIIKFPAFKLILNVETRCYSSYGAIFRKFIISRLDAPNAARAPGYRRRGVVISKKKNKEFRRISTNLLEVVEIIHAVRGLFEFQRPFNIVRVVWLP